MRMVFLAEGLGGRLMRTVAFFFFVSAGAAVCGASDIENLYRTLRILRATVNV